MLLIFLTFLGRDGGRRGEDRVRRESKKWGEIRNNDVDIKSTTEHWQSLALPDAALMFSTH